MSDPIPIGTIIPLWGRVVGYRWGGGERYYLCIRRGVVSYIPACAVERPGPRVSRTPQARTFRAK